MSKITHAWVEANLEQRIAAHVHAWEQAKSTGRPRPVETLPFITISREFGCEALPLAQRLVQILNERCRPSIPWVAYDREVLDRVAQELHLRREVVDALDGRRRNEMSELFDSVLNRKVDEALMFRKLAEVIRSLAAHGHAVLVGRGSHLVTQDLKTGLHIRLEAPRGWRVHRVMQDQRLSQREAEKFVEQYEKEREHFMRTFFVHDPKHPLYPDVTLDNSRFNLAQIAEIVFAALGARFGETLVGA
jgi:cytidylate kinase